MTVLQTQPTFTATLTNGTFAFDENSSMTVIQVTLTAGAGSYKGNGVSNGVASSPIPLKLNQPVTLFVNDGQLPTGVLFSFAAGTVEIVGR